MWHKYLWSCLDEVEQGEFRSILGKVAPEPQWMRSLKDLSTFLARQSKRPVIVLIDEYEAPLNLSYEHDFFPQVRDASFIHSVTIKADGNSDAVKQLFWTACTSWLIKGEYDLIQWIFTADTWRTYLVE